LPIALLGGAYWPGVLGAEVGREVMGRRPWTRILDYWAGSGPDSWIVGLGAGAGPGSWMNNCAISRLRIEPYEEITDPRQKWFVRYFSSGDMINDD
jgi:hypothetical protein